jgi:hypothetical protein
MDGALAYYAEVHVSEIRTLQLLLSRLEHISADSSVAYRASGVRGSMLRVVEKLETGRPVSDQDVRRLIESAYLLLQKAAKEKIR